MANRILKESICTSDDINALSLFEEVLFYRLIVICDDFGRMDARAAILKARMFPLQPAVTLDMVEAALHTLEGLGCIKRYQVDGRPYLYLPTWGEHQRMRNQRGKYPGPDEAQGDASTGGDLPQSAADGSALRPESESETQSETESEAEAEAEPAAAGETVAAAADAIGLYRCKRDRVIAAELARAYGAAWVAEALRRTAEGPNLSWRYVRGILSRWQRAGGIDPPGAPRQQAPTVNAQRYTQVEYTREELSRLVEAI